MGLKLWPFKEALINMANNVNGVDNYPLYDVINPDQLAGWVPPNSFEQRMYQLPHNGSVYNRENKMI